MAELLGRIAVEVLAVVLVALATQVIRRILRTA